MLYELRHSEVRPFGIIIENDTPHDAYIDMLGDSVFSQQKKGIKFLNMFGDSVFEDNKIWQLKNFLMGSGGFRVRMTRFNSRNASQLGEAIGLKNIDASGRCTHYNLELFQHRDPMTNCHNVVDVMMNYILDCMTELHTKLLPFSNYQIMFFPLINNDKEAGWYNKTYNRVKEKNKDHELSEEKRQQLLLLM